MRRMNGEGLELCLIRTRMVNHSNLRGPSLFGASFYDKRLILTSPCGSEDLDAYP